MKMFLAFVLGSALFTASLQAQFVYVANSLHGGVTGYSINYDGSLTAIPGGPFAPGIAPGLVVVDPRGEFVYAAGEASGGYSIAHNGALTPVPGTPFRAENGKPFAVWL